MSTTKGFEVDFKLPGGKIISRHIHKLDEMKGMVEKYKIPSVTIHSLADKWTGTRNEIDELTRWPVVPDKLDEADDECPVCVPRKK